MCDFLIGCGFVIGTIFGERSDRDDCDQEYDRCTADAASNVVTTLAIPTFDSDCVYLTHQYGIDRYPMEAPKDALSPPRQRKWQPDKWLETRMSISESLVLAPSRVLIQIRFGGEKTYGRVLLLDRAAKAYYVLPWEYSGPMAITKDGKRLIRFAMNSKTVNEFRLLAPDS